MLAAVASIPEAITEETLKKYFNTDSSRLTKWLEVAFEAQGLSLDARRETEIEDMRNIILSALAIQREELNILAERLLQTAP
ncbi:hypothetical protein CFN17_17790 [Arthrobacter sp. PM3]|nr:hypothetical protein CFN17_17790 [Arthrobacter sp. PM3]